MKRLNNSIVEYIKESQEEYDHCWDLFSQFVVRDEDTEGDEVGYEARHGHDDADISSNSQCFSFNHDWTSEMILFRLVLA